MVKILLWWKFLFKFESDWPSRMINLSLLCWCCLCIKKHCIISKDRILHSNLVFNYFFLHCMVPFRPSINFFENCFRDLSDKNTHKTTHNLLLNGIENIKSLHLYILFTNTPRWLINKTKRIFFVMGLLDDRQIQGLILYSLYSVHTGFLGFEKKFLLNTKTNYKNYFSVYVPLYL